MPGVDRECVTHHMCDCTEKRLKKLEERVEKLRVSLRILGVAADTKKGALIKSGIARIIHTALDEDDKCQSYLRKKEG